MRRNPGDPQRKTEANARRTQKVIDTYHGKSDLLRTWELLADNARESRADFEAARQGSDAPKFTIASRGRTN